MSCHTRVEEEGQRLGCPSSRPPLRPCCPPDHNPHCSHEFGGCGRLCSSESERVGEKREGSPDI
jgi:hypothetical protein